MKSKILFIIPSFNYGGTVFSTLNLISMLDREKYEIDIFAMSHKGPVKTYYTKYNILKEDFFISAICSPYKQEKNIITLIIFILIKLLSKILSLVKVNLPILIYKKRSNIINKDKNYNIVVSCQEGEATYLSSYFNNSKKIAWFRSEYSVYKREISKKEYLFQRKNYLKFNHIICVSETTKNDFCKYHPNLSRIVTSIHNIQNIEKIIADSKMDVFDISFSKDTFLIVSIGRLHPHKRFNYIPKIAADLRKQKCEFKWLIIGDGDQKEKKNIQNEINLNNVNEYVICIGGKLNPYPYIKASNLVVNTSYVEACPRVVIESKILHVPVICSDFSSSYEFINHDFDGFISPIEDIYKFISKMIKETHTYNRVKQNCNNYSFDVEKISNQLEYILNEK